MRGRFREDLCGLTVDGACKDAANAKSGGSVHAGSSREKLANRLKPGERGNVMVLVEDGHAEDDRHVRMAGAGRDGRRAVY